MAGGDILVPPGDDRDADVLVAGTALVGLCCGVVAAVLDGGAGALSALIATTLVAAFFSSGALALRVAGLTGTPGEPVARAIEALAGE